MSELEDTLSSVLSDPEQMARLRAMAKSLMGGAAQDSEPSAPAATPPSPEGLGLGQLGALLKGGGEKSRQLRALEALLPCLSESRARKLSRAIRLSSLLRLAGNALPSLTSEADV